MAIVFKKVSHVYMEGSPFVHTAIEDIDLTIPDGQFVGLIGHTGSGKSTLIQHINGLLKPSRGTVEVDGLSIALKGADIIRLRKLVGLVFQYPEYQLFEETVERDVAFGPRNQGLKEDEITERVRRALAQVGIGEEAFARSPFELSGGQRRRVAIAGVLAMEPKVLILDEPTAGLDPHGREEVLALVKRIHTERGCTVIMVSHSMDEVARVADRVLVMNRAQVVIDGTPREVFARSAELKEMDLDVPAVAALTDDLRARGMDLPQAVTLEELRDALLARLQRGGDAGVR